MPKPKHNLKRPLREIRTAGSERALPFNVTLKGEDYSLATPLKSRNVCQFFHSRFGKSLNLWVGILTALYQFAFSPLLSLGQSEGCYVRKDDFCADMLNAEHVVSSNQGKVVYGTAKNYQVILRCLDLFERTSPDCQASLIQGSGTHEIKFEVLITDRSKWASASSFSASVEEQPPKVPSSCVQQKVSEGMELFLRKKQQINSYAMLMCPQLTDGYADRISESECFKEKGVRFDHNEIDRTLVGLDPALSTPYVLLRFNSLGAKKIKEFTEQNVGKRATLIVDGRIVTAPFIRNPITSGELSISGGFNMSEAIALGCSITQREYSASGTQQMPESILPTPIFAAIESSCNWTRQGSSLVKNFFQIKGQFVEEHDLANAFGRILATIRKEALYAFADLTIKGGLLIRPDHTMPTLIEHEGYTELVNGIMFVGPLSWTQRVLKKIENWPEAMVVSDLETLEPNRHKIRVSVFAIHKENDLCAEFPLACLELSQIKLTAVRQEKDCIKAVLEDGQGRSFIVQEDSLVGKNHGRVMRILSNRVVVVERLNQRVGSPEERITELKLTGSLH